MESQYKSKNQVQETFLEFFGVLASKGTLGAAMYLVCEKEVILWDPYTSCPPESYIEIDGVRFWGGFAPNGAYIRFPDQKELVWESQKGWAIVEMLEYLTNNKYVASQGSYTGDMNIDYDYVTHILSYKRWICRYSFGNSIYRLHEVNLIEAFLNGMVNQDKELRSKIVNLPKVYRIKNRYGCKKIFHEFLNREDVKFRNDDLINTNFLACLLKHNITL